MSDGGIVRAMTRCRTCRCWWSVGPDDEMRCPCGGELAGVDMEAHMKTLPVAPYDASKDPRATKKGG